MGLDNDAEKLINFDSSLSKDAIDALMELSIQLLDTKAEAACVKANNTKKQ